ncbi:MAG: hypothetical protein F6J90_07630 [Moorea sp. SIOASIH]|uniref:hypothetical protein n=1 Tax=Moorena sp. SIOASIH TaxID=2607817 RepID=UPI0013B8D81A|nr:hypothetical protein [Moorena sp. SIOASIH]NEO36201.1 hypothetical protein [Moorena sp. SIOASIH]
MGRWGVRWFHNIPSCLLPLASCLPLLGGVRGGFLLPLAPTTPTLSLFLSYYRV